VGRVTAEHRHYDAASDRLLAALDAGDSAAAADIAARAVDSGGQRLAALLAAGAAAAQGQLDQDFTTASELNRVQEMAAPAAAVTGTLVLISGGLSLARYQRRLERQALLDALTGLPNRVLLRDRISQVLLHADRDQSRAALLLIDLDRFKEVNDALGHHYGDQLLLQVGERLRSGLSNADTVACLGGDEFAVLLPGILGREAAVVLGGKLQALLEEPFVLEGVSLDVEASVGIALFPDHGTDADGLLQHADIAMYAAKEIHAGIVVFDAKLDHHSPGKLALLGDLRRAIEQGQLVVHYQPKVDAHDDRLLGVEALVRWRHPDRGLVPPDEFIPLAERTALIGPLTHQVLETALRQCRLWCEAGQELSVAVNVSARRLLDLAFPDEVARLLADSGTPARLLVVEITESTIMLDPAHALETLRRLDDMGVRLSIDDFGTGYSSMSYLKNLPVHELKIDRTFVSQMASNASDAVIVRSTIDLGRNLGLSVVAEGVEDAGTLVELSALGCDAVQGYHISRPLPADELDLWIEARAASRAERGQAAADPVSGGGPQGDYARVARGVTVALPDDPAS
jgi:diguanylate cyclase (GGDEF)-like protein